MADPSLSEGIAVPNRQPATLPGAGLSPAPNVYAHPDAVALPGTPNPDTSNADALTRALGIGSATFGQLSDNVLKEQREEEFKKGQQAQQENQDKFADAQAKGIIPQAANPWFIRGYQNQDGRVTGLDYGSQMQSAYEQSPAKGNDDPAAYQKFLADFKKQYAQTLPKDRSTDWWDGFRESSQVSDERMARAHAEDVTRAVIARQEVNTGAEANTILNSTHDPMAAADGLNKLAERMRLEGMPDESYRKVVATAILAKAKLGDPSFLKALDYVKAGGPKSAATLASDPNIAMARADTTQWLIQKAQSAQEFAWRADEHNYQVTVTRPRAQQEFEEHEQAWQRQKDTWSREDQTRNTLSRIQLSVMADPEHAKAVSSDAIKDLAKVNPAEVDRAISFVNTYPLAQNNLSPQEERPFVSKIADDINANAGNPAGEMNVIHALTDQLIAHQINQTTFDRYHALATTMSSFDTNNAKLLNSPFMDDVFNATKQVVAAKAGPNPFGVLAGTTGYDFLDLKVAGQNAARAYLAKNPSATAAELADVARKTIMPLAQSMGYGNSEDHTIGVTDQIGQKALKAVHGANSAVAPSVKPEEAVKTFNAQQQMIFTRHVAELQASDPESVMAYITKFDQEHNSPGLGKYIIEQLSAPQPTKKK